MNDSLEQDTAEPKEPTRPRRRLHFSLLTLMMLAAIICLSVSHFRTSWELHQANADLERYRWEAGELHMTNQSQVHVVGIKTHRELVWQWRVFLPEGHDFEWHARVNSLTWGKVPKKSQPELTLPGGETYLLTAAIYRDPLDEWKLKLTVSPPPEGRNSGRTIDLTADDVAWISNNSGHGETGVRPGSGGTSTFEIDEPALLLRYTVHERLAGGGSRSSAGENQGVMFWLRKN